MVVASIDLPPGNYIVQAKGEVSVPGEGGTNRVDVNCSLNGSASGPLDQQRVSVLPLWAETTELLTTFTTAGEVVSLICEQRSTVASVLIDNAWLVGLQVDPLLSTVEPLAVFSPVP